MKVGLMLPIGEPELLGGPDRWAFFRDQTLAAEESGLDSVWCADHILFRFPDDNETHGIHEGWTVLSSVGAITNRVEVGSLVLCVPFRNPALTAKMATTLDEVTGGRLILGLGCGWHEPEFDAFGYEFDHRVSQFAEALEIIMPMLKTGSASFEGSWQRATEATIAPPGPRPTSLPVLIAGKGPRMLDLVARHADQWNSAWYGDPAKADRLRENIDRVNAALDAVGRDRGSLALTAGVFVATEPADDDRPEDVMSGSPDEIAEALLGYEAMGISHVIVHLWPRTVEAVHQLGAVASLVHRDSRF
jgi:alkanesulfonate monooxygenase SsuD/methylene tetrahydromethanopterin reductase-like flavin-dependent oxidoreductase (luciferase family)